MIFEICNNFIENIFISTFIAKYINLKENKISFILITTLLNTIISTILTSLGIIGFIQTLSIQLTLLICLYKLNKSFSYQDVMISLFTNILLFISAYFSILILSIFFNLKPYQIYGNNTYLWLVVLSKIIFLIMLIFSLKKRPLQFIETNIDKLKHLLSFEFLIIMLMAYYFTSFVVSKNFTYSSNIIFICFIFLIISFCYIVNQFIYLDQKMYEAKLKGKENKYAQANLNNLKNIKFYLDNTEHKINYILQSIEFDLHEKKYDEALKKIKISKELIYKISPIICTHNEIFDFLLNLEIKQFIENKKKIKICTFISKNQVYNKQDIINHILNPLKILFSITDNIELFISESDTHILEVKFIIIDALEISTINLENMICNLVPNNLKIKKSDRLITIQYKEHLDEYY